VALNSIAAAAGGAACCEFVPYPSNPHKARANGSKANFSVTLLFTRAILFSCRQQKIHHRAHREK
jgi:hypothetical protein